MIVAIKTVLDLMAEGRPLALYCDPSSVDDPDSGIGCPYMADALNHPGTTDGVMRGVFSDLDAIGGGINGSMPNNGDSGLLSGATG